MGIATNLTGRSFGRLTAVDKSHKTHNGHWVWNCSCKCGNHTIAYATNLVRGLTKSCGCYRVETTGMQNLSHGHSSGTKCSTEYRSWCSMKQRCVNPKNKKYPRYGARGITICERWINSFENFFLDMGKKPSPIYTIDRINNDGNYESSNCKWSTPSEQCRNRSNNRRYDYNNTSLVLSDWAMLFKVNSRSLSKIIKELSFEYAYNKFMPKQTSLS